MRQKQRLHKTIYVTGITGFIGKNLIPHLLQTFDQVINFTRNGTLQVFAKKKTKELNISQEFINDNPSDCLINLATLYQPYPKSLPELEQLVEANILFPARVIGVLNSLENLKIINAVSYHQLLDFPAQNIYSLSKELFKKFLDHQSFEVVNVYIFDTFGAGDERNKVTDIFINNILTGKTIIIPENEIKINLSDSQSVCISLSKSIDLNSGSYSLMSPDTISLESLANKIMEISQIEVPLLMEGSGANYFDDIKEFPQNIYSSYSNYSLQNGLKNRILEIQNLI